jgi:hypothetical protein
MELHVPTLSGIARSDTFAANSSSSSSTTTTTPLSSVGEEEDEADLASLFGEDDSSDQDGAADRSAGSTPPTEEEDDYASLFGEDETPDHDNLAGSNTSNETEPETELTLAIVSGNILSTYLPQPKLTRSQTPAAPRMTLHLPLALPGNAQEETVAGSSSSTQTVGQEMSLVDIFSVAGVVSRDSHACIYRTSR